MRVAELVSGVCQPNHHITVHCPNDNPKFRNIIRNAEGIRDTTWHILYSISFPRFISCHISRNFGLSLGQCTSIVGAQLFFLDCLWVSVQALLGHNFFFGLPLGQCTSIVGHNCFFGLSLGQCTSIVGHNCFLDCLWDSVQALLGHNCFFGLSLGQCTSIVRAQLFFWIVFGTVYQHCWVTIVKSQSRLVLVWWVEISVGMCVWHILTDETWPILATLSQKYSESPHKIKPEPVTRWSRCNGKCLGKTYVNKVGHNGCIRSSSDRRCFHAEILIIVGTVWSFL